MEDCVVLNEIMDNCNDDISKALPMYSKHRNPDAEAIIDLALYNYLEMRDHVNSRMYLLRKKWDNFVYTLFPTKWVPLYTMVTFSRERYHLCIANRKWQDKMVGQLLKVGGVALVAAGIMAVKTGAAQEFVEKIAENVSYINNVLYSLYTK